MMTTEPHPLTHEPREIAGSGTALLLLYARRQAGEDAVRSVIETSGVPFTVAELEDTGNWFSQDTKMRLLRALIEVLDDPMAPRKSGYSASENITDNSLVLLLRAFGSPRAVYRKTTMGMSKLSTVADLELLDLGRRTATFRYKMKPGYTATREDCEFALGFMCVTPAMFDLPLATVVHDECEVDGYPACIYRLTWQKYSRFARRKNQSIAATIEVSALRGQLRDLQVAASALVMSEDIDTVRARILDRASTVVQANGHLLLLHDPDFGEPIVTSRGLTPAEEAAAVKKLLRKQDLGASAAVVDVASGRMLHGRLAALRAGGVPISDEDRSLFEAYGHHSAAALELVGALTGSRSETSRARALLTLAKDLAGAVDDISVARIAASALPRISDGRASGVLLWDSATGVLKVVATAGHDEKQRLALEGREISTETTPELRAFLTERKPTVIEAATASPALSTLIGDAGSGAVVVVPLIAGDELMGVVTVGWQMNLAAQPLHEALSRVTGVADQVATALQNVRLLATVRHQANHDALSGLPNRVLFSRVLEGELRRAVPDQSTAVLFCDLDQFKQVNDRLGHAAGDEVLRQVSIRLREQVRDKDTVARLSGDEFAVVLTDVADELQAVTVARRIVECLDQPLRIDGHEVRITSSVGVALHTGPDGRAERLLAAADAAMYSAKKRGRDQVAVSGEVENNHALPSLEAELSMAAGNGELRLHFQPVVDVSGGSEGVVVGAEALLRWQHPRLGLLAPGSFLPLAEDAGLVTGLDLWALQAACAALATWEPGVRGPHRIAVNLAADTLVDRRLLPAVRNALTTHRIAPDQLHLEVVESRSLTDVPGVVDRLVELRQLGVSISLDDFGTGFSTLAWLQTLPVDQIKIDRTFVMALTEGGSIALIRGVVALANELGISVVAEGVEEPHQLAMLREAGCTLVQGYLLGRPEPEFADEVLPFTGRVHTHG